MCPEPAERGQCLGRAIEIIGAHAIEDRAELLIVRSRQVREDARRVEVQPIEVDDVDIGLQAGGDQAAVEPVYEAIPGWRESTAGARSWAQLPAQAIKYIRRVEELIACPVALVSTSPEREDTILVRDPFAD